MAKWSLYCDGSCRPNPGQMFATYALFKGRTLVQYSSDVSLGEGTNNLAEITALYHGLCAAAAWLSDGDSLTAYTDSQLLKQQLAGRYAIRAPQLEAVWRFVKPFFKRPGWKLRWISREQLNNKLESAKRLANI